MSTKNYASLETLRSFLDNLKNTFAAMYHRHTISELTDYVVDTELSSTSTNSVQNKVLNAEFDAIANAMNALDLAIDQASIIYVGPDEPTDPNIKVWINTTETDTIPMIPRITSITLNANSWIGSGEPYSQIIDMPAAAMVTANSKIDLQPDAATIVNLQNAETSLMVENNGSIVTCYAIGNKPNVDYTMQVLIQEVSYV